MPCQEMGRECSLCLAGTGVTISLGGAKVGWGHLLHGDISSMGTSCWGCLLFWGHLLAGDISFLVGDTYLLGTSPLWPGAVPMLGASPGACWRGRLPHAQCGWQLAVGRLELARRGAPRICHLEGLSPQGFVTPRICHPETSLCPTQGPWEGLLGVGSPAALPQGGAGRCRTGADRRASILASPNIPCGVSNPQNQTSWGAGVEQSGDVGHVWPP